MEIEIIQYEDRYNSDFKALNLEWLDKYGLTEQWDLDMLNDPNEFIIRPGGVLYLARAGNEIIGTAGLMKEHEGVYELVKMAVSTAWRGKGIGTLLIEKCLDTARAWKAERITLHSNSKLKVALGIYEKYGFRHIPLDNSPLVTADVRMELMLDY